MRMRALLIAALPLGLIAFLVWIEKAGLWRVPQPLGPFFLVGSYLIGARGMILLPLPRTPKCILGAFYTVAVVPAMMFTGLLTSCAMGDCI